MLRLCRVHWNGDSLEVHGTNPQWEHLAIDDTWDADPAGLPVVNVAGVPDIGCAPSQPDLSCVPRAALAPAESCLWCRAAQTATARSGSSSSSPTSAAGLGLGRASVIS